jgi:hypothetical protein
MTAQNLQHTKFIHALRKKLPVHALAISNHGSDENNSNTARICRGTGTYRCLRQSPDIHSKFCKEFNKSFKSTNATSSVNKTSSVLPSLSSDACLESSDWSGSISASLVPTGPFLQTSPEATLNIYNPSEFRLIISAPKMETVRFSETLASTNQSTRRLNPGEQNQNCYRRKNLKSHKPKIIFTRFKQPQKYWLSLNDDRNKTELTKGKCLKT